MKQKAKAVSKNVARGNAPAKAIAVVPQPKRAWSVLVVNLALVFLVPLVLFIVPVVRYDEARLPTTDGFFMFALSACAWRDVLLSGLSVYAGALLWQTHPGALRGIGRFFTAWYFLAFVSAATPLFVHAHSIMRKTIRVEQAVFFLVAAVALGFAYAFFSRSREVRKLYPASSEAPEQERWRICPIGAGMIGITLLAGAWLSAASFLTKPIDLFEAAWEGDLQTAKQLVAAGEDVGIFNDQGMIALHYARTAETAQLLGMTESRNTNLYLLASPDIKNLPSLVVKFRSQGDPVSQFLWAQFSPVAQQIFMHPGVSEEMLRTNVVAELNRVIQGSSIYDAGRFGNVKLSERALKLQARQTQGGTLTHLNRLLLEDAYPQELARSQIEHRDNRQETPLHLAALNGRPEVALFLIDQGADPNGENAFRQTPLDYARLGLKQHRRGKQEAVIAVLLQKGAGPKP